MPELPEVETIVRTLSPQVCGKTITGVHVLRQKSLDCGADLLARLNGARIERVFRRAKLLLMSARPGASGPLNDAPGCPEGAGGLPELFASDLLLAFHLKMTGKFFVHPEGAEPLKHTRIIFDLCAGPEGPPAAGQGGGRLFFDDMRAFAFCRIMRPGDLPRWPFWASLGPEPLEMSAESLARHLAAVFAGRKVAIKAALLDQRVIAGIGNIYADEALFKAGISPERKASDVDKARLAALAEAIQAILRKSIEECGSSIRDYRDALGNAGAFQNSFAAYGRKGQPCTVCGGIMHSCRVAGRGTVFCPRCQD